MLSVGMGGEGAIRHLSTSTALFVENQGQWADEGVRYGFHGDGVNIDFHDTQLDGPWDGFLVKLTNSGSHLWSTYVGGFGWDHGYGIATDTAGNVYVTGRTASIDWVSGGYNGGVWDGFLVKYTSSGTYLWSTYLGGNGLDWGWGVARDAVKGVYVAGETNSSGWISGGWDTSYGGNGDAFLAKLTLNEPPDAPAWIDLPSPNKLYPSDYPETPDDTNGPYVVTVDYTDPDGRDDLQHVYLRLTGESTPQTIEAIVHDTEGESDDVTWHGM